MKFRYPWRDYQAAVLADLDTHLRNRKLHVVAAPGAGKTVLGLEVMRRLGKPILILSPSLTIRNQWVDRLVELFLPKPERPDWISTNLKDPRYVTLATYQALHTDCDADALRQVGVSVVMLDEAHHLRNAWWEALNHVVAVLDAKTVSLTATPPYDVSSAEWQRYNALCGPLDAEISIPELVKSGDLAPHQDLIHLSQLRDTARYLGLDIKNENLRRAVRANAALCDIIEAHPWIADTRRQTAQLLAQPALFSAMLVYLHDAGRKVPAYALRVLGVGRSGLPALSDHTLEVVCQGLMGTLPDDLKNQLTKLGALYRGRVTIPRRDEDDRGRILRNAPEKYYSIRDIIRAERTNMGADLRLAILTEHVGANAVKLASQYPQYYAPDSFERKLRADPKVGQLDAGSAFERLRLEPEQAADMALLTGSLCIVPAGTLAGEGIAARPLAHDARYDQLALSGAASGRRVQLISDLLAQGTVRVLIGTRALLGQGWDAPSINSLILAANVKSFVSSNQIRGRAIRRNPTVADKAANIWHIATIAPGGRGPEVAALEARFDTFVHLDTKSGEILSGFPGFSDRTVSNRLAMTQASERASLGAAWQKALVTGRPNPRIAHRIEMQHSHRALVRTDMLAQTIPRVAVAGSMIAGWAFASGGVVAGILALGASGLLMAPAVRRVRRFVSHGTLSGSLHQTGMAVLHAMIANKQIHTPRDALRIKAGKMADGFGYCTLEGATLPEETRFLNLLEQVFAPIDNPRYILVRESYLGRALQMAPYAVPNEIGRTKAQAQAFQDGWRRFVGPAHLIYTRTVEGRMALLQARTVVLADARIVKRRSVWE